MSFFPRRRRTRNQSCLKPTEPSPDALIPFTDDTKPPASSSAPHPSIAVASITHNFQTNEPVNTLSLTPDTRFLALGTNRPKRLSTFPAVQIYETSSFAVRTTVVAHKSSVRGVSLTPDAAFLASCDHSGVILVTDAVTGVTKATLLGHNGQVEDVVIDPTGARIASAGCDTTVKYWDTHTARSIMTFPGHTASVLSVVIASNASIVFSTGHDGAIRAWDSRTGKQSFALRRHSGAVMDCATDPDARLIASCGTDRKCNVWDCRNLDIAHSFTAEKALHGCDIAPAASRIVVSGDAGVVKGWDVASGITITGLDAHDASTRVRRCAISAHGQRIFTAGMDNMAVLFDVPSPPTSRGFTGQDTDPVVKTTEIERLFYNYLNSGVPLTSAGVARAIDMDFRMKQVSRLSSIYVGHVCVRTLVSSGQSFDNDIGDTFEQSTSFFYQKLYHKISELVNSQRSQEFAERILRDAQLNGIISEQDVNSILGDALSNEYTRDLFAEWSTVMSQVYEEVTTRIATIESRLENLSFDVSALRTDVDKIETKMERAAKVQRYANLVKFGLALIPFVGSAAMAFTDGSVGLIMSLDLEGVVELFSGLFSTAGQAVVDTYIDVGDVDSPTDAEERKENHAVQVVQYVLSDGFLNKIQPVERQELVEGLETRFGGKLESLRYEVKQIIHEHVAQLEVPVNSPTAENSEAHDENRNEQEESSTYEALLVAKFRSGGREHLSYKKACTLMKEVIQADIRYDGKSEDVDTAIAETLAEQTDDIYSLVDEACFLRSGKVIASKLRDIADARWGKEFDRASAGDTEIDCTVAEKMLTALIPRCDNTHVIAQRIMALFGQREVLCRDEFVQVAKDLTGE